MKPPNVAEWAWERQSVWSQVADRLKRGYERDRWWLLGLTVASAVLSAGAVAAGLASDGGKVLAFAAAAAAAFAGIVRARTGKEAVQKWTRGRSVSEAIKSEVYLYLTRIGDYGKPDRDERLDARVLAIQEDAQGLRAHAAATAPTQRALPAVYDLDSYLEERVGGQIERFYEPRAKELAAKLKTFRSLELVLAAAGALLAAAAGTWEEDAVAVWVPVVTTVAAAITTHVGAGRFEFLLEEYRRTEEELLRVRDRRGVAAHLSDEELVRHAEQVISVQNEGWMAKLTSDEQPRQDA